MESIAKGKISNDQLSRFQRYQLLYSFLVPITVMFIAFLAVGIAPLGRLNLMAMDAYAQYFPMLREYIRAGSDWSFAGALGFNQVTQSAYYTNSPLWLLLHLVPEKFTLEAIHLIVLVRFGLAGLSFAFFLQQFYQFRSNFCFVFATAYALSSYTLSFINQFMWMDIIILLPLLAASLFNLWEKGRPLFYILVLATALYTNFYLAFFLCIFAVIWSLYLIFKHPCPAKKRMLYLFRFGLASLIAAGLVAFVLLPVFLSLQNTLAAGSDLPDKLEFYHPFWQYLLHLLPFQKISLAYEAANIYCGFLSFLLAVLYLFHKRRTIRERIIFLIFAIGFYLSFNLNLLDYLWHGFHYPNQLPARQSFLFIFILLIFAYKSFYEANYLLLRPKRQQNWCDLKITIVILLLFEIIANTFFTFAVYTWKADHREYIKYEADLQYLTKSYQPLENEFYRMEFLQPVHNQGLRYGYNGLGYYSSLMSGQNYLFFKDLGMDIYANNVSTNYVADALLNNVLAVRYLIQINDKPINTTNLHLVEVEQLNEVTLYENPYYYAIGFAVEGMDLRHTHASQLRGMLGDQEINDNCFLQIDAYKPDEIKGRLKLAEDAYLLTSIGYEEGWKLSVNGVEKQTFPAFDYMLAAPLSAGDNTITLTYVTPGKATGLKIASGCFFLLAVWLWLEKHMSHSRHCGQGSSNAICC